jgi:hypothetical protein
MRTAEHLLPGRASVTSSPDHGLLALKTSKRGGTAIPRSNWRGQVDGVASGQRQRCYLIGLNSNGPRHGAISGAGGEQQASRTLHLVGLRYKHLVITWDEGLLTLWSRIPAPGAFGEIARDLTS